jgi:hypothetical protein
MQVLEARKLNVMENIKGLASDSTKMHTKIIKHQTDSNFLVQAL